MSKSHEFISAEQSKLLDEQFNCFKGKTITVETVGLISDKTAISLPRVEHFALGKGIIPLRYQRNIGTFGIKGQMKLLESTAVIIGLGGLGGNILEQISRAGIGKVVAADPDGFDLTNLNRQILSTENVIGSRKTDIAKQRISLVNSAVEFVGNTCKFQQLAEDVWQKADIVFDCLDNIPDRLTLADKCEHSRCPLIHGAIAGWYAEVGVVWPGSKMLHTYYLGQSEGIEKELGTPASTAAMAASVMTVKGIEVVIGTYKDKDSTMHVFSLQDNDWGMVTL